MFALPSPGMLYFNRVRFTFIGYALPSPGTLYLHQVRFTFIVEGKTYLMKVKHP
jgi:hypothetical protein